MRGGGYGYWQVRRVVCSWVGSEIYEQRRGGGDGVCWCGCCFLDGLFVYRWLFFWVCDCCEELVSGLLLGRVMRWVFLNMFNIVIAGFCALYCSLFREWFRRMILGSKIGQEQILVGVSFGFFIRVEVFFDSFFLRVGVCFVVSWVWQGI